MSRLKTKDLKMIINFNSKNNDEQAVTIKSLNYYSKELNLMETRFLGNLKVLESPQQM